MERAIEDQVDAMASGDFVRFIEADDQFHSQIFSGIGMMRIWNIITNQGGNHHRIRLLSFTEKNVLPNIIEQHRNMVEALKTKQMETILNLEDKHLSKLLQETELMVQHYPNYFKQETSYVGLRLRPTK
ncbi:hypothetical protein SDC9_75609 [bioreactor metagenome]|uniref:GntR C-terminal domain-containing protein n=1 Tax=bioreactor metagenome TaxID=1076179 RepID=A0A644YL06_9ZZZZ